MNRKTAVPLSDPGLATRAGTRMKAVLAYALWPRNRATFEHAAKMPLRED